jgi:hypothetical protein
MTAVSEARDALSGALSAVPGLRVVMDPGATIQPPAAVVSLPDLRWEAMCTDPTGATFSIAVVVKLDDRSVDRLQELVLQVAEALDSVPEAVVLTARTGTWNDQLPAYLIETEVSL